jgi:hypothetical protein
MLAKAIMARKPMKQKGTSFLTARTHCLKLCQIGKRREYLVAMSKGGLDDSLRSDFWHFALSGGDSSDYEVRSQIFAHSRLTSRF